MNMDITILTQKELFLERVVDRLGREPLDYVERLSAITAGRQEGWRAAGVLVLLYYRPGGPLDRERGEFYFQLIKRSAVVPQPGDLSCPGGMLHPVLDRALAPATACPLLPFMRGRVRVYAQSKGGALFRATSLFLTNALRESWEEVRLSSFNVVFLGVLPSSELLVFRRSIFPVVWHVKEPWVFRPNWEVEKIVEIPLRAFFQPESYGTMTVEAFIPLRASVERIRNFPCLILEDGQGGREVLWGATLNILLKFFKTVFDYEPPMFETERVIKKSLFENYVTGNTR